MMSATAATTVTWWIPLASAAVGVVAGLGAGLGAAVWTQRRTDRREDMRWERERTDRAEQWRREDSLRWLQDRQQAYARLLAALYEWDRALLSAIADRQSDVALNKRTDLDAAERINVSTAARELVPLVLFMAPETVRSLTRVAITDRESFWIVHLTPDPPDLLKMDEGWTRIVERTSWLREAMRIDLGVESESTGQRPGARTGGGITSSRGPV
jgi:hypothetical protein